MKSLKRHSAFLIPSLVLLAIAGLFIIPGWRLSGQRNYSKYLPVSFSAQASEMNRWSLAVQQVKADRGEPMGKQAKVEIPSQVRHYGDTRRFLAIQVAEVKEHGLRTPQDLVELGEMIKNGEMVSLSPATDKYVLFGVGGQASKNPFTRYINGKSIPLYNEEGLRRVYQRNADERARSEKEIAGLKQELSGLGKRERSKRAKLQSQIAAAQKEIKASAESKELLDSYYGKDEMRAELFDQYESLAALSKDFRERDFNIEDDTARRDMKVRMLSSLRPEALKVLEEIAASYHEKFQRPLPITSLVRPDEYQTALSKVNPNATKIDTPPHSTGLAFDIYYRYMTAEEQAHVMDHLAKLKDAARIEVLRENRDHYHVFAFLDGSRPNEKLIASSRSGGAVTKAVAKPTAKAIKETPKAKKKAGKASKKAPARKVTRKARKRR
jgi:hypothetical protein